MKSYIDNLPSSTHQMLKKPVLKVDEAHNDEIVRMTESNSIYVDNKFYTEQMKEKDDPNCSSFPVKVKAMRIDWMLSSEDDVDGYNFLQEILRNEDLSFYNLQSMRMIIEFLYKKIKFSIFALLLPCYICNQILFVSVALVNELLRGKLDIDVEKKTVKGNDESKYWTNVLIICLVLNLLTVLVQASINYFMFLMQGWRYFKRFWTWIDLSVLVISIAIMAQFVELVSNRNSEGYFEENYDNYREETITLRIMLMFGQMLLFSKSQQFLTMVD